MPYEVQIMVACKPAYTGKFANDYQFPAIEDGIATAQAAVDNATFQLAYYRTPEGIEDMMTTCPDLQYEMPENIVVTRVEARIREYTDVSTLVAEGGAQ